TGRTSKRYASCTRRKAHPTFRPGTESVGEITTTHNFEDPMIPQSIVRSYLNRMVAAIKRGPRHQPRNARLVSLPSVQALEARALLATTTVHVFDVDFSLNPKRQPIVDPTIHVGESVHWVWDEGKHSTTSVTGQSETWDSGLQIPSFSFDHTFTHSGTF